MSSPFVAEIRMFAGNFAPTGWANCDGQLMPISQNTALFSLLGTMYGGDGKSTFALPDLQGCVPMFWGQGAGLSETFQGETSGAETVTLLISEIPIHAHAVTAKPAPGLLPSPATNEVFGALPPASASYGSVNPDVNLAPACIAPNGGSLPHNNMQPYLALTFIIALQGVFPARG